MLEIHPVKEREILESYMTQHGLPADAALLQAYENGEVTGHAAMTIAGEEAEGTLTLHTWDYTDDFTGELLLRAVISYAFNRAVPTVSVSASCRNAILERVGFQPDGENLTIATKNVVHFCQK
ncbi:MAG: hypothetical protein IIZ68_09545 [Clostridia bacterium]|nr:hypothetical protein [Clostridia bacterium]MBQ5544109.1 hypothetical protein [Clostridia bacterium]